MKKFNNDPDGVTKVDLSKPPKTEEDAVQGETTDSVQDTGSKREKRKRR